MMFTEHWTILNDLPLFWDPEALTSGYYSNVFRRDLPSRFALVPRHGSTEDIRWFEADPTFVLHWTNAYEDGDEVVLVYARPPSGLNPGHPVPFRRLVEFDRVSVTSGGSATIDFSVPIESFALVNEHGERTLYPGTHSLEFSQGSGTVIDIPVHISA